MHIFFQTNNAHLKMEPTPKEKQEMSDFGDSVAALTSAQKQHQKCETWTATLLQSSPILTFLTSQTTPKITCTPCSSERAGGFAPNYGIVLCENQLQSRGHLEDTLAHELIHQYDNETVKLDWRNVMHLACTEIRAANLSRECGFTREIKRGKFGLAKQHQVCVRRLSRLGLEQR